MAQFGTGLAVYGSDWRAPRLGKLFDIANRHRPPAGGTAFGPGEAALMDTDWNASPLARGTYSKGDTSPTNVPTPRPRKGFATASQGGTSEGPHTGPRMEPDRTVTVRWPVRGEVLSAVNRSHERKADEKTPLCMWGRDEPV